MEVIPVPLTDQHRPVNNIRTRTFFIVDACLDEELLKNALDSLIRHSWRKLGARLTTRHPDGLLEYRLPRQFEDGYALFEWSSKTYEQPIGSIPSLPKVPSPGKGAALLPCVSSISDWFQPSDWPYERKDELPDAPMLYVHLSFFADATVLAMNCPHVLGDQYGLANIMKAWLEQVKGQAPSAMVGLDNDILSNGKTYTDYQKHEVVRKGRMKIRRRMEYAFVLSGFIVELVLQSKEEAHTLFLPCPLVESLRERHSETLRAKYTKPPSITNGDIISAIILKLARMAQSPKRTIGLTQTVNMRGRLPQLQDNPDLYVHNALHYGTSRFKLDTSMPLSEIAYQNRLAINEAIDPKDMEIGMTVAREAVRRKQAIHICEPFEKSYNVSNWTAAWKALDFSPAVKINEKTQQQTSTAPKLLVLGEAKEKKAPARFSSSILCKTDEGYWCHFAASVKTTKLIQAYLDKDPMLENL